MPLLCAPDPAGRTGRGPRRRTSYRHPSRSASGSALAVTVACEAAGELAARLDAFKAAEQLESEALGTLAPAITGRWRDAVGDDLAAQPFSGEEEAPRARGDDALIAYGSTLLLAIAGWKWLALAQIGDGDIVGIQPAGQALLPVPSDPSLDKGFQTTSLCAPRAEEDFRVAVVDLSRTALLGVLLATDGYGNAQADRSVGQRGQRRPGRDDRRAPAGVAGPRSCPGRSPAAPRRTGSADDTTVALLIAPSPHRR